MRNLKAVPTIIAAAGLAAGIMAVEPQTTQDYADGNRLVINGKPLFISGMNIAWNTANSFGNDVGDTPLDVNAFTDHIKDVRKAGGNAVRWWLHTDAANCPKINSNGEVTGIGTRTIQNMQSALDIAYEYGVVVSMCLFSFDLLVPGDGGKGDTYYPDYSLDNNYKFLTVPANLDTYINNALRPMLDSVGNHPAVMCWEVFNEAEGMLESAGWQHVQRKIPYSDIIRFTAKIAAYVHNNTKKMASTGIASFQSNYLSEYTDTKLKAAAGNDSKAYLDFYMGHYYPEYQGTTISPFHNSASYWNMDRPVLIGEFPARDWPPQGFNFQPNTNMTIINAYEYAYNNGYCGALSWSMTENETAKFGDYQTTKPALENLYNKYESSIKIKDVVIEDLKGDLVMKLALTGLPVLSENWSELGINKDMNFSGKSNITFDMFIQNGSGTNLDINVVVKTGNAWDWNSGQTLKLTNYEQGKWVSVTVPISSFGTSANLSQVKSLLFQYGATGTPYNGVIYFDNIKYDNEVVSDFNDQKAWSLVADNSAVSVVTRASVGGTNSVFNGGKAVAAGRVPSVAVKGKILSVVSADNSDMRIKMVDMRGKTVANFKSSGSGQFSLTKIPAGRYLVETRIAGKRVGTNAVMVK